MYSYFFLLFFFSLDFISAQCPPNYYGDDCTCTSNFAKEYLVPDAFCINRTWTTRTKGIFDFRNVKKPIDIAYDTLENIGVYLSDRTEIQVSVTSDSLDRCSITSGKFRFTGANVDLNNANLHIHYVIDGALSFCSFTALEVVSPLTISGNFNPSISTSFPSKKCPYVEQFFDANSARVNIVFSVNPNNKSENCGHPFAKGSRSWVPIVLGILGVIGVILMFVVLLYYCHKNEGSFFRVVEVEEEEEDSRL
eukprot:TRINITY_DN7957_c0_g1_i1.p1 TRINITY_DN7957_c0_g1~~TRINITY_DN7957_c0_g1_i1.p1  ORF type:complete len:265 (-),score=28.51 TRINITY_DN7957_c0_g1_i1:70-822(-)